MRMNKYPFLLWLTQEREDLKIDLANSKVYSDELGQSSRPLNIPCQRNSDRRNPITP